MSERYNPVSPEALYSAIRKKEEERIALGDDSQEIIEMGSLPNDMTVEDSENFSKEPVGIPREKILEDILKKATLDIPVEPTKEEKTYRILSKEEYEEDGGDALPSAEDLAESQFPEEDNDPPEDLHKNDKSDPTTQSFPKLVEPDEEPLPSDELFKDGEYFPYRDEEGIIHVAKKRSDEPSAEPVKMPNSVSEFFDPNTVTEYQKEKSKIKKYFSKSLVKFLYGLAVSYEYTDNNEKAEIVAKVMSDDFKEIGTGTNRTVFIHGRYAYKIALDRRGIIDNWSEFKRSPECPELLAKTYECNGIIAVSEYVTVIEEYNFLTYGDRIMSVLRQLAESYIFGDMGYSQKNFCNIGYRDDKDNECVILDYAYMHPRAGNNKALRCHCGGQIEYDNNFTGFYCTRCRTKYSYMDIKYKLDADIENIEARMLGSFKDLDDLENPMLSDTISDIIEQVANL